MTRFLVRFIRIEQRVFRGLMGLVAVIFIAWLGMR